jgi:hydroxyacid-oxoacid transhydrogenase
VRTFDFSQKDFFHLFSLFLNPTPPIFFLLKMAAAASRTNVTRLLSIIQSGANACPCHSHAHSHGPTTGAFSSLLKYGRNYASAKETTDYAFEMAASNIRFGPGVTR